MVELYQSEKNFLEKIADSIPGIAGYREKEKARDTDKRLREYIAHLLDRTRDALEELKGKLLNQGRLDLLDDIDTLSRKTMRLADTIRYASYGYAGLFDQLKFKNEELARLYEYDTQLFTEVSSFHEKVWEGLNEENPSSTLVQFQESLTHIDQLFQKRSQLFHEPGHSQGGNA